MRRLLERLTVAVIVVTFAAACGGGQKVKDKAPTDGDPADLDAPSAEELAASPCGSPDWSKLPEGSDEPEPTGSRDAEPQPQPE